MNYIVFGGSGFIGTHLIKILSLSLCDNDLIYIVDIKEPSAELLNKDKIKFINGDVRNKINFSFNPSASDVIFNFAAIHRTPGHPDFDYYETNIKGAMNIVDFAEQNHINMILFTSSIAVYGSSEDKKFENTMLTPNTPYGISKAIAESIHEKWQLIDRKHRSLIILRPGVVFGAGENGNFNRMIKAIKNNYFIYPGRKDTIKACIYVKELVNFMNFITKSTVDGVAEIYNCTYEPAYTIEQICEMTKEILNVKRKIYVLPAFIMLAAASILKPLFGKSIGIHPQRVRKLMTSTNISGIKLQNSGYNMLYSFKESLADYISKTNF